MRQRIKLALAIAHDPQVLVLDEPLNGLDPMARAEVTSLFRDLAAAGMHVVISSHILHEVDMMSDRIIMMSNGYVVAEGDIQGVRSEMEDHPMQILIRCDKPSVVASHVFGQDSVVEVKIHADGQGLVVATRNADQFYSLLNRIVLENGIGIEAVAPADENGLIASIIMFGFCTIATYLLLFLPSKNADIFTSGPGFPHLARYVAVAMLGCLGYGAVFLLIGLYTKNPVVAALAFLGWESFNFILPAVLQKISVVHYLQSLCPVAPPRSPLAILTAPTSPLISIPGLLIFTACILLLVSFKIRRTEITYSAD